MRVLIIFFAILITSGICSADDAFEQVVIPFVEENCAACHDGNGAEGGFRVDLLEGNIETEEQANLMIAVLDQLHADLMPPQEEIRPDKDQRVEAIQSIEAALLRSDFGEAYRQKLLLPEYGNHVDHDLLFSGSIDELGFSPSRLWRLSPEIYQAQHGDRARSPFIYSTSERDIQDFAYSSNVDETTIDMIVVTVEKSLEDAVEKLKEKPSDRHRFMPFLSDDRPTAEQCEGLVSDEFRRIHSREPSEQELGRYLGFLNETISIAGNLEAMKALVLAMHLSPEAIFRMELGLGAVDEHGRRRLSDIEVAHSIAYALTNQSPFRSPVIVEALASGDLASNEGVKRTVEAILWPKSPDDSRRRVSVYPQSTPRVTRFFAEFFNYEIAEDVFKDDQRIRDELGLGSPSGQMQRQAIRDLEVLIEFTLREDQNVLGKLLTTDQFFVAHPGDNDLARQRFDDYLERNREGKQRPAILAAEERGITPYPGNVRQLGYIRLYDLPHGPTRDGPQLWDYPIEQPISMPGRMGVLTHPAWLWAHSTNFDNDPIHRGIWIRKKLLAGVIADVPPDVDARVPEDPHLTLRERMDVVRPGSCWKCHERINPLGETFEVFDDWGRPRSKHFLDENDELVFRRDGDIELLLERHELSTKPVDASGRLDGTGDPSLDGQVTDAYELIDRLARSDRVRQSFVRHTFRYFLGRNEMLSDSRTLIAADEAFVASGGSFRALVVSLLTSDSFLYRR